MPLPTILITGGAGYVGSQAAIELLPYYRVIVYDNLSRGFRSLVPTAAVFAQGDLHDTERLAALMAEEQVQAVLHFAAYAYVGESVADPGLYFENNVGGTVRLLEAMRRSGVDRIVFSSSCTVYGLPETPLITEAHPLRPISPYGQSKLMAEQILGWQSKAHALRYCVLRYFNAAGCDPAGHSGESHRPEPHVIPRLLLAAAGQLPYFGVLGDRYDTPDGTCIRDYIHVSDLARAHRLALGWLESGGDSQTWNLGTGVGTSVRQLIAAAEAVTGHPIPVRIEPARPGDPPRLVADAGRALRMLRWEPVCSDMKSVLGSAWQWMNRRDQRALAHTAGV